VDLVLDLKGKKHRTMGVGPEEAKKKEVKFSVWLEEELAANSH
jgi:hypothetical protein